MTLRYSPSGIEPGEKALLHYDSLLSQVLNKQESFPERSLGLALFIRQGMLAWIEVCHRCTPANSKTKSSTQTPVFALGATSEMIKIMANITLCNLEEALS